MVYTLIKTFLIKFKGTLVKTFLTKLSLNLSDKVEYEGTLIKQTLSDEVEFEGKLIKIFLIKLNIKVQH